MICKKMLEKFERNFLKFDIKEESIINSHSIQVVYRKKKLLINK